MRNTSRNMRKIQSIYFALILILATPALITAFQCPLPKQSSEASRSSNIRNLQLKTLHRRNEKAIRTKMSSHWGQNQIQYPAFPPQYPPHITQNIETVSATAVTNGLSIGPLPEQSVQGVYQIKSEEEYLAFLDANPDKLVIVKFFASYCRACKVLEPKLLAVKKDPQLEGLPIIWAEFASQRTTKDLFQQKLRVMTLPTIHFYANSGLVENFPCPPNKISLLKKKIARFLNTRVDPETLKLKEPDRQSTETEPRVQRTIIDNEMITEEHIEFLRNGMPFFTDLTDHEFSTMLQKARLLTFNAGDVIRKQGMPGDAFYVIKTGIAEMYIKSKFDDPIKTPPSYLGVVVSTLKEFDYFGERALTTGEPFAASFQVLEKVRCFAFDADIIPPSSILSKKRQATREMIEQLNQRYVLPDDYTPSYPATQQEQCILELLVRFKQIRQAAKCFDYIMKSEPSWGDPGEIARRSILVRKLSYSQRNEFNDVFNIVDVYHEGRVSLLEMQKFMASAQKKKSDKELQEMIDRVNPREGKEANTAITREEFMGLMAEAEFYNLFKETFQELDFENSGYVRAGDLDEVLGGVRDLIAEKKHSSIIDDGDMDMLVDYDQYTKMLLGAAL